MDEDRSSKSRQELFVPRQSGYNAVTLSTPSAPPVAAPANYAGTAIMLPKSAEPDSGDSSATSAFRRGYGLPSEPASAAKTRTLFDDASGRSGYVASGLSAGEPGLKPPTTASPARGRPKETADSSFFFSKAETAGAVEFGRSFKNDGRIQALGEPSPPVTVAGRSGSAVEVDSLFSGGPAPATPPVTSVTPLPNSLNKQIAQHVSPAPAQSPAAGLAPPQDAGLAAASALPQEAWTAGTANGSPIAVGQGFAYLKAAGNSSSSWVRNFTVGALPAPGLTPTAGTLEVSKAPMETHSEVLAGVASSTRSAAPARTQAEPRKGAEILKERAVAEVTAVEPPSAQETAVNEAAYRQSNAAIAPKLAEAARADNKALGFDWYLGNEPTANGQIKAQSGTAPQSAGQPLAEAKAQNASLPDVELAWSDRSQHQKQGTVAPAEGTGRFYRTKAGEAASDGTANFQEKVKSEDSIALPPLQGETTLALQSSSTEKSRQLFSSKRELEEAQRLRQILDMKIASEGIDVSLPKTTMVEITDRAKPASAPSSTLWDKLRGRERTYKSTARVKIARDQSDFAGVATKGDTTAYDPYFAQTEFEALQSEAVLGKVIDKLNLKKEWANKQGGGALAKEEALARLKKSLELKAVPNSSLIEVGASSDNADEAARIANAVAEAYLDNRLEQRRKQALGGLKTLQEENAKLRQSIASVEREAKQPQKEPHTPKSDLPDTAPPKPAAPAPIPQPEVQTGDNAFSTFSLNVSDVSFKLAAASLEKGLMPEPATVRSEEFINAFDYRDPEPPPGVPVAFAWERAQYPFAQNRDLLRFSIKTAAQGRQPGRPLNLVLLLDNSGSMERADRVQIIREALRVLAGQLQPQDKFSVVTFARTAAAVGGRRARQPGRPSRRRGQRPHPARRHQSRRRDEPRLPDRAAALPRQRHQPRRAAHRRRGQSRQRGPRGAQAEGRGQPQAGHRARLLRHRLGRLQRRLARSPLAQRRWPLRLHQHARGSGDGICRPARRRAASGGVGREGAGRVQSQPA